MKARDVANFVWIISLLWERNYLFIFNVITEMERALFVLQFFYQGFKATLYINLCQPLGPDVLINRVGGRRGCASRPCFPSPSAYEIKRLPLCILTFLMWKTSASLRIKQGASRLPYELSPFLHKRSRGRTYKDDHTHGHWYCKKK